MTSPRVRNPGSNARFAIPACFGIDSGSRSAALFHACAPAHRRNETRDSTNRSFPDGTRGFTGCRFTTDGASLVPARSRCRPRKDLLARQWPCTESHQILKISLLIYRFERVDARTISGEPTPRPLRFWRPTRLGATIVEYRPDLTHGSSTDFSGSAITVG